MDPTSKRDSKRDTVRPPGVFTSQAMQRVLRLAMRAAPNNLPVLITGESGTGKEVVARFIHDRSGRPRERFVPYNCTGLTREIVDSQLFGHRRGAFTGATEHTTGLIRAADRGTLLLDEIGELDAHIQPKLLRVIENREIHPVGHHLPLEIDVRILAATNVDIDQMVRDRLFRADLFYRLNIVRIHVPPLRDHREDIPPLVRYYLRRHSREQRKPDIRISGAATEQLLARDWPGNIRQLANEIRRLVTFSEAGTVIRQTHLTQPALPGAGECRHPDTVTIPTDQPLPTAVEQVERALITKALVQTKGRFGAAAERLGISRKGLLLMRRRLNIDSFLLHD